MSDPNTAGAGQAAPGAAGSAAPNAAGTNNMVPLSALQEEREKRQTLASELETLKTQVATLTAGAANGNTNGSAGAPAGNNGSADPNLDYVRQLDGLWREDPRRAMQAELMMAINWQDQVNATVDEQLESLAAKNKDFGAHQAEVRRHLRKLPLEQRAKPGVAEAAYYMVKGRTSDSAARTEAERLLKQQADAAAAQGITGGSSGGGAPAAGGLSPEEKAAAAALGISEVEYLKYRK